MLQYVAACCSVLQCVAVTTKQSACEAGESKKGPLVKSLQFVAVRRSVLQCVQGNRRELHYGVASVSRID